MLAADRKEVHVVSEQITFLGRVRLWDESSGRGLAVIDVPGELVERLGGRRQFRVTGTLAGVPFAGSTMLVAGGGLCAGISKAALTSAHAVVGDTVEVTIGRA
jgi:hypothetical protein